MDRNHFAVWLDAYVEAWRSNDPATIARLFSENARYFYGPYAEPVVGRDAIVASWLEKPDDPDSWQAEYAPLAIDGEVLVATGESIYFYGPYAEPVVGRDAIVASWLEKPDDPNSWEAEYAPLAIDGEVLVATGESIYFEPDAKTERTRYNNIFVCRFDDDGRCREFREWFIERPRPKAAAD